MFNSHFNSNITYEKNKQFEIYIYKYINIKIDFSGQTGSWRRQNGFGKTEGVLLPRVRYIFVNKEINHASSW